MYCHDGGTYETGDTCYANQTKKNLVVNVCDVKNQNSFGIQIQSIMKYVC